MNIRLIYGIILTLSVGVFLGGFLIARDLFLAHEFSVRQSALIAQSANSSPTPCVNDAKETFSCYENYYTHMASAFGTKVAFDDLKARYPGSDLVKGQCHQLAHGIGHAAGDIYPNVSEAFVHGDSFCWSGYYHGVMEELLEGTSASDLSETIAGICNSVPGKETYSFDYYNCVHGLGHGVMAVLDDELFDSLAVCGTLPGMWERTSCASGVFMENIMVESRGGGSKYLKTDDMLYPCTAVSGEFKAACYLMQTSHVLTATDYDFSRVFTVCASAESAYRTACYQSIGRDASGSTSSNVEKTHSICMLGADKEQQEQCATGAAKDFVSYFHSDAQAKTFCGTFTSAEIRTACNNTVDSYYLSF